MMHMRNPSETERGEWPSWKALMRIAIAVFVVFLLMRYWGAFETALKMLLMALTAVILGFCIAYLINIPMRFFERHLPHKKGKPPSRALAMIISIVVVLSVVIAVLVLVLPQFLECMLTFGKSIPVLLSSLESGDGIAKIMPPQLYEALKDINWDEVSANVFAWFQAGLVNMLPQVLSIAGILGTFGIGCIFAIWMLLDKENLATIGHRLVRNYLGPQADDRLSRAAALLDDSFRHYVVGQTLEATILGTLITLGALLLGLPYASMLGPLVALMSFIPMIGALLGGIIGAIMILSVSWQQALIFFVMFIVIQQIEANFIYPRVVGKLVGLSGFWTLLGITVGGALFGIVGAFIGVPTMSALYRAIGGNMAAHEEAGETFNARFHRVLGTDSDHPEEA